MSNTLKLGKWASLRASGPFATSERSFAGISGGRTSAMMAALLGDDVTLSFQNTGREHPKTLDFLHELDGALGGRIVWLEFRKPATKGARPRESQFAVVDYKTADRSGGPFEAFMETLAEFRETKGKPPFSPWAGRRVCTAYMKNRTMNNYVASLGIDCFDSFIGLRADEEKRVLNIKKVETAKRAFCCPLFDAGIQKCDVMEFWSEQSFDLDIRENQGNCTGCFLKDQSDLARVLAEPETDAAWWIAMEEKYPDFGGREFRGYASLLAEGPMRLRMEDALRNGRVIENDGSMTPRRFHLVLIQESKRLRGELPAFSCSCEASMAEADNDQLELF